MDFLFLLEQYLTGQLDYSQGVALYEKYGTNTAYKKMFRSGDDPFARKKLKVELQAISDRLRANSSKNDFRTFTTSKKAGSINLQVLPTHLREEHARLSPLIREISRIHAALEYQEKGERFESAARILLLTDQRRAIFNRLDFFMKHGRDLPVYEVPALPAQDTSESSYYEAQYKLKLLRTQRSKLKKNPKRAQELERVCREITKLENTITDVKRTV